MNKQLLLIDDDIDELYILNEALDETHENIVCRFIESIEEGLIILKNTTPDLIFLDINMPRIGGFEALSMIKKMTFLSEIPVILYSTAINEQITERALALGAAGCIKKTDSIKQLVSLLRSLFVQMPAMRYND